MSHRKQSKRHFDPTFESRAEKLSKTSFKRYLNETSHDDQGDVFESESNLNKAFIAPNDEIVLVFDYDEVSMSRDTLSELRSLNAFESMEIESKDILYAEIQEDGLVEIQNITEGSTIGIFDIIDVVQVLDNDNS